MAVSRHELAGPHAGAAAAKRHDSRNPVMSHLSLEYRVTRLVFDTGQPYEKFRGRYEAAVPPADLRPGNLPGRHVRWPDGAADADGLARHGFVLYWRADMTPELTRPGDLRPCTAYLMGHHALPAQ